MSEFTWANSPSLDSFLFIPFTCSSFCLSSLFFKQEIILNSLMIRMKERQEEEGNFLILSAIRVLHKYELITFHACGSDCHQKFRLGSKEASSQTKSTVLSGSLYFSTWSRRNSWPKYSNWSFLAVLEESLHTDGTTSSILECVCTTQCPFLCISFALVRWFPEHLGASMVLILYDLD